jgi:hypothetical protein
VSAFEAFVRVAERALPAWPEGLDACADALRALAVSDALRERVARELDALAARPTHTPPVSASRHYWVLWAAGGAKLTLVRVAAGEGDDAGYLTDSASHQLLAAVGPDPVVGDRYEQAAAPDPEVMRAEYPLTRRERVTLREAEVLSLRARRDVFDFLPLPEARYLLILDGPRVHTQQWVYARETGTPVASLAADPHDARLEAAMRLLRVLGHTAAAPVVASFATHDAHFVRWTAIRHTMGLDPERGVELLRAALDDPHPHVRNAARKALQRVDGV